jgi:hypothetical protein
MHKTITIAAALALSSAPAFAQYQQQPQSDPATQIEQIAPATDDSQTEPATENAQSAPSDTGAGAAGNMVSVSIPSVDVLGDFVSDSDAKALDSAGLPMTVELPLGIAANACGIDQDELEKSMKKGGASCTARNGSRSLAEAVMKAGGKP